MRTIPTSLILASAAFFCTACESGPDTAAPLSAALGSREDSFLQPIDGTALDFEMIWIPSSDNGEGGGLWVSRTEVTWEIFDVFVYRLDGSDESSEDPVDAITRPSKPYIAMDRGFGHAGFPALSMSFHGAQQFCKWLSAKTGRTYRLPTEEEWLMLCAQSGITEDNAEEHAWFKGNAKFKTHEVGTRMADDLGLYDLWGNAGEWCSTGADDDRGVVMGGSYKDPRDGIGCSMRQKPVPAWNASDPQFPKSIWWLADAGFVGFRLVCEEK